MHSFLFLEEEVLEFKYTIEKIKAIEDTLKIGIFELNVEKLTTEEIVKLIYLGLKDMKYSKLWNLMEDNYEEIFWFAMESLNHSLIYEKEETSYFENDYEDEIEKEVEQVFGEEEKPTRLEIDEMIERVIEIDMDYEVFYNLTYVEFITIYNLKIKQKERESNEKISLEYFNAVMQRVKKMPKLDKFVKRERKIMTDEEMYKAILQLDKKFNK